MLDKRRERRGSKDAKRTCSKEKRVVGTLSTSKPPPDAPGWAVRKEGIYKHCMNFYKHFCLILRRGGEG